ncbi:hypothetical protein E4T66_16305 [Sinimarinibacterium sp. CAU 1509]|uniref:lysophospholipid acyltransferase family protein n=1 Tax=Sinimarinibacterium sp. CAU 1509 TaxID=2562283 RepID=UPI0010AC4C55|nr:lysophospholipid acyltransferase family protein [Sinimarinibacterium sp. CAU 1509]TJY58256.1 hypothetical protein E4T66_16305 [Sinimarinibacterium sp. CAU 1509]
MNSDRTRAALRRLLTLLGHVPLPGLHGVAAVFGTLLGWLPNRQRQITRLHLERCLPDLDAMQRRQIERRSLVHMLQAIIEAPVLWFGPESQLRAWLEDADARRQLEALRAQDKGVIWLCPHIGAWELAGLFCSANGPMTSLYKPQKGAFDALVREGRSRLGAALVPTTGAGVKSLLAALKNKEMIGILPDHDPPPGSGEFAPLFGIPAHTTELVSKLAARSGAPVWFCIAERRPRGRGYALHLIPAPADVGDPETGVAALNRGVEDVIRRWPQQYWWSYKRYRRRPPDQPRFY